MSPASLHTSAFAFVRELQSLTHTRELRQFAAGDVIFQFGEPGDGFYVIESGAVRITAPMSGGHEFRMLATLGAGDMLGEMAVIDNVPRSATARAEHDTTAWFFSGDELLAILESSPRQALNVIRVFSRRMRALDQKYTDEIIQAERLAVVGRFSSTIVHDFKNPLNVIGLAAEVACGEATPPALRRKAQATIARQSERMTDLLQELIEFARPTGQRRTMEAANFSSFMLGLVEELRPEFTQRHVTLELAGPPPEVRVHIDPKRLARVFYNLLNNAVDVMPDGGAVTFRFVAAPGELRVEVEDPGPGIAPEIAQQLFQPFATHGKSHGTGLGLSICKKIVDDHGGRLWVRSEPGHGAVFCFTLPLTPAPSALIG